MEIIAKKNFKKGKAKLTKNKTYDATYHKDEGWLVVEYFEFFDDNNQRKILHPSNFKDFFFTKNEYRKLKLKKLKNE
jgi:hypothetical protein